MDLYLILKLLHVVAAILWVGGASIMTLLVIVLERRGDDEATLGTTAHLSLLGNRVFLPLSLFVIATGLPMAWLGGWGLQAWTVLATLIVVLTAGLGGAVLGPTLDRAVHEWKVEGDTPKAIATGRRLLRLVKLDLGAQFAIISLMVLKPGWTDPALAVPAACVALGVLFFALGSPSRTPAVPA